MFFGRIFGKKEPDESVSVDEEPKKRGFKSYLIIGLVLIVIIAVIAIPKLLNKPASATEAPYTLADAQANITTLSGNYTILAGQVSQATSGVAKATSDIAGINSRISGMTPTDWQPTITSLQNTQQSLQSSFAILSGNVTALAGNLTTLTGNTTAGNGTTFNFTALNTLVANQTADLDKVWDCFGILNATLQTVKNKVDNLVIPPYVVITDVANSYIGAVVHGTGNFTVILTIYGSSMETASGCSFYGSNSKLRNSFAIGNTTLVVCLEPIGNWVEGEVIGFGFSNCNCTVDYASATTGGS